MSGFGAALGSFGQTFPQSGMRGYEFIQQLLKQKMEREAARGFGGALGGMGGQQMPLQVMPSSGSMSPYPQPPSPGMPPQQFGEQPVPPGSPVRQGPQMPFPRPKPPMGGQPMPGGPPQQGGGQVVPFPRPKPEMGGGQPQMPMQGGPPDAMPRQMTGQGNSGQPGGGGQGPFQGMTLQNVIAQIKQHAPGISDEALGMAVDRFMPMLNADAQFQWRQMVDARAQRQLDERAAWHDRRGDQMDQGLDIKRQNAEAVNSRFHEREGRLREKESKVTAARLSPEQATNQKFFAQRFNETSHTARSAYDALTRLQSYGGKPEDVAAADEAYTRADALRWQAQQDYERFLDELKTSPAPAAAAPAPVTPAKPATKPAAAAPAAGPPPPPGFQEAPSPQSSLDRPPDSESAWTGQGGPSDYTEGPLRQQPAAPARRPFSAPAGARPNDYTGDAGGEPLPRPKPRAPYGDYTGDAYGDEPRREEQLPQPDLFRAPKGAPAADYSGQGSGMDRDQMRAARERDENAPIPASSLPPPRRMSGEELENYATSGKPRLSQMSSAELREGAARAKPGQPGRRPANDRQNRRSGDSGTPIADQLDRFVTALEERRARSASSQSDAEGRGNAETGQLYEENERATDAEANTLIARLAKLFGVADLDELLAGDEASFSSKGNTKSRAKGSSVSTRYVMPQKYPATAGRK